LGVYPVSLEDEVVALFRNERLTDPFPVWNRLREEAPVFSGSNMTILSRYADVKAMLPDGERYSAKYTRSRPETLVATFSGEMARMSRELADYSAMSLAVQDGADHERLRGIAHRFFTARRVLAMESEIQRFFDDLVAEAAEQNVYDHKLLSQTLALRVITHIVGCPHVDGPLITDLLERLSKGNYGTSDEDLLRDAYNARYELNEYIDRMIIAEYRRHPDSNEFVRAMMDAEDEDNLSALELGAMVSVLLFGGVETTAILLSTGLLVLLQHRDQWEWLCDDPVERVPGAVEELFRYVSPAQFVPRVAAREFEIHGITVPAGQAVIGAIAGAHRDPAQYENPELFDIGRGRPHLGLGIGPKFCLGASVARAEARIGLTTLAQRYPGLQLAVDSGELDWSGGPVSIRSLRELPIRLGSPAPARR
jgi:cytochrome P450